MAIINGTSGDDTLNGTVDVDDIHGLEGNDSINGLEGSDSLYGDEGDDQLFGGDGDDLLSGGDGDDYLVGGAGLDFMLGGNGNDTFVTDDFFIEFGEELTAAGGIDTIISSVDVGALNIPIENLILTGSAVMGFGNWRDNRLEGNAQANTLNGGDGSDQLTGGDGADVLTGGAHADSFTDTAAGLNGDTITDLEEADRIVITDADISTFSFSLTGTIVSYSGGSLTLGHVPSGRIAAAAASSSGVQLTLVPLVQASAPPTGDFNGDGRDDLIWRRSDGAFTDWLGQLSGGFASNDANAWRTDIPMQWQVIGSGDFNGDNRDDLIWRNANGAFTNWLGQPNGGFVSNDSNALSIMPHNWHVAGTGDFNGDNRDDVLWRSNEGGFIEWLGQTNGGFLSNDIATAVLPTNWHIVGTGDFNGDNRDDLIWRRDDGAFTQWLGQADGTFASNDAIAWVILPTYWQVAGTGDFNGDNYHDVAWRRDDGAFTVWLGHSNGSFSSNDSNAWATVPQAWQVAAIGDFNGDHRDDVAWRHENGVFTTWSGQLSGGFVSNDANAWTVLPISWQVHVGGDQFV